MRRGQAYARNLLRMSVAHFKLIEVEVIQTADVPSHRQSGTITIHEVTKLSGGSLDFFGFTK